MRPEEKGKKCDSLGLDSSKLKTNRWTKIYVQANRKVLNKRLFLESPPWPCPWLSLTFSLKRGMCLHTYKAMYTCCYVHTTWRLSPLSWRQDTPRRLLSVQRPFFTNGQGRDSNWDNSWLIAEQTRWVATTRSWVTWGRLANGNASSMLWYASCLWAMASWSCSRASSCTHPTAGEEIEREGCKSVKLFPLQMLSASLWWRGWTFWHPLQGWPQCLHHSLLDSWCWGSVRFGVWI